MVDAADSTRERRGDVGERERAREEWCEGTFARRAER